jgi:hypothetical protein
MTTTASTHADATLHTSGGILRPIILGAVGGMVAGAIFGALNMWYAHSTGMPWNMPLKMIATIVQGQGSLMTGKANPIVGLAIHMVLSMMFGVVLALVTTRQRSDGERALTGLVFGAALYVLNFVLLAHIAFHAFKATNQPVELTTHLVFGAVAVLFLLSWRKSSTSQGLAASN